MFLTVEFTGTSRLRSPWTRLPAGVMVLAAAKAAATSSGVTPVARSRSGTRFTRMVRALPPKGGGAETPGKVANSGRTVLRAASCSCATDRVSLEKTSWPTGTLPASKRITKGGTVPGGIIARARLT